MHTHTHTHPLMLCRRRPGDGQLRFKTKLDRNIELANAILMPTLAYNLESAFAEFIVDHRIVNLPR